MKVEFRKSFTKDLKSITDKSLLKRVKETIETVEQSKTLNDLPNRKKLKSEDKYFRLKIGDYRLGFALENDTVIFVRFLHRKEIYKFFP
ncbi:MAG: type II toxin-antitoxin system RelE/ParE family toxin [Acidobacteria bacterium]|jgi:mRNA interferase RelE/StbE|nr:type II toxin-antitoxin system RelE/ParE family toxin [Acidobacteriota bacterium]HEV8158765.1 type II toxin-antitoxin system RelE/ParE family toxin [Pyrinomonadaceae bacterium]